MGKLNVVGLGPGNKDNMTFRAYDALIRSDYLVGYTNYIKLIPKEITGKEIISTGMGDEVLRCFAGMFRRLCNIWYGFSLL